MKLRSGLLFALCLALPAFTQTIPTDRYPVVIVMLENHPYSSMYLSSSMPNLTSMTRQYAVAQNFDSNGHYSVGNYMFLTFGKVETTNDSYNPDTQGYFSDDNIVRHLIGMGKTYKMYEESIDSAGSNEMTSANGLYVRRHNPLSYTSEFGNMTTAQRALVEVPFSQFATDLNAHQLPDYSFVTPNLNDDAHTGSLQAADSWLQTNIFTPLFADKTFQQSGMLIISVDESYDTDCLPLAKCPSLPEYTSYCTSGCTAGGGHILTVVLGPNVNTAFASSAFFMHESTLKSLLTAMNGTSFPNTLSNVPTYASFYQSLVNPGFELASINWHAYGSCSIGNKSGVARTGTHYADLIATGPGSQPVYFAADENGSTIYYPVKTGQKVTFNGWGSRYSGDGSAHLVIEATDSNKNNPGWVVSSNVNSSAWNYISGSYTVPSGKSYLRFYLEIKGSTQSSEVRFDDVNLQIQ